MHLFNLYKSNTVNATFSYNWHCNGTNIGSSATELNRCLKVTGYTYMYAPDHFRTRHIDEWRAEETGIQACQKPLSLEP